VTESDQRAPVAILTSARMGPLRIALGVVRAIRDAKEAGEDVRVIIERVPRT
jgi:hypothetical protein